MSELISGKEALIAIANGEDVEGFNTRDSMQKLGWWDASTMQADQILKNKRYHFRLKPSTITINGIEVPAPFEPKVGDIGFVLSDKCSDGYEKITVYSNNYKSRYGMWNSEDEIKQVVELLQSIFK